MIEAKTTFKKMKFFREIFVITPKTNTIRDKA